MKQEEQAMKIRQIIAKASTDEGFRRRLIADPAARLKEEGIEIPAGLDVRVVEDGDNVVHLVIPAPGRSQLPDELGDDQLDRVAGGWLFHN